MSNVIYVIYSETVFNDMVTVEVVNGSYHSTYNSALQALNDLANEFDVLLDEDESSFSIRSGGSTIEYYIDTLTEEW